MSFFKLMKSIINIKPQTTNNNNFDIGIQPQNILDYIQQLSQDEFFTNSKQFLTQNQNSFYKQVLLIQIKQEGLRFKLIKNFCLRLNNLKLIVRGWKFQDIEQILNEIKKDVNRQEGLFLQIIKLWINYCMMRIHEIVIKFEKQIISEIQNFIKEQLRLFIQFILALCKLIYKRLFQTFSKKHKNQPINQNLIKRAILSSLTYNYYFKSLGEIIVKNLTQKTSKYNQNQILSHKEQFKKYYNRQFYQQNCFLQSISLLKLFYQEYVIQSKIQKLIKFIQTFNSEMKKYRVSNEQMGDIIPISFIYVLYHSPQNIIGAIKYMQILLCYAVENKGENNSNNNSFKIKSQLQKKIDNSITIDHLIRNYQQLKHISLIDLKSNKN